MHNDWKSCSHKPSFLGKAFNGQAYFIWVGGCVKIGAPSYSIPAEIWIVPKNRLNIFFTISLHAYMKSLVMLVCKGVLRDFKHT